MFDNWNAIAVSSQLTASDMEQSAPANWHALAVSISHSSEDAADI